MVGVTRWRVAREVGGRLFLLCYNGLSENRGVLFCARKVCTNTSDSAKLVPSGSAEGAMERSFTLLMGYTTSADEPAKTDALDEPRNTPSAAT